VPQNAPYGYYGTPYVFGLDPIWQVSTNKIMFQNAFKMKMSVLLGVTHMLFGVFMSLWNAIYFKKSLNIFAEFIPQVIFLCGLFGYLCFLILIKWWMYYATMDPAQVANSEKCAPNLIIVFINMMLFNFENKHTEDCLTSYLYPGQQYVQMLLVLISVCCVPVMLFVKPLALRKQAAAKARTGGAQLAEGGGSAGEEKFEFGDTMILQGIHTIEYCLGSISHTASYLRLWALSLAHAQLSEVLWTMVLANGLGFHQWWGGVILWAIFAFWAFLTISILVLMEGLSAFLHTLRLHWVEFQSKFYKGEGYIFIPFSFEDILKQAELDQSG